MLLSKLPDVRVLLLLLLSDSPVILYCYLNERRINVSFSTRRQYSPDYFRIEIIRCHRG